MANARVRTFLVRMVRPSLVWLRQDLRLDDQSAISAAASSGPFAALYVLDDETPGQWAIGRAQRWWLHHSLEAFGRKIRERGGVLLLRRGPCAQVVPQVARELGAGRVHATRHYEPWWQSAESEIGRSLLLHAADTLVPLEAVRTGAGGPYRIYTPFYRALSAISVAEPSRAPERVTSPQRVPASERLEDWGLLPTRPNWAVEFSIWTPGEEGAAARVRALRDTVHRYAAARDLPSENGTSMLSPHLHFGEVSPRRVWHEVSSAESEKFRKELIWRDFSRNVVAADPAVGERDQRPSPISWREGPQAEADFKAWTRGRTGYPIVDAGMRQLWRTGWMHNRVRMIAASFLVKHLLIDWRRGARWFWDTLVDADYANNSQSWQWIAATGFDSQPFNRMMAPLSQSSKFQAAAYIREWVPELSRMDDSSIHDPQDRQGYPPPLIGHREARERALASRRSR